MEIKTSGETPSANSMWDVLLGAPVHTHTHVIKVITDRSSSSALENSLLFSLYMKVLDVFTSIMGQNLSENVKKTDEIIPKKTIFFSPDTSNGPIQ